MERPPEEEPHHQWFLSQKVVLPVVLLLLGVVVWNNNRSWNSFSLTTSTQSLHDDIQKASSLLTETPLPCEPYTDRRHDIPPVFDKAGMVVFYHIAKTGGTTVRELFTKRTDYWRVCNHSQLLTMNAQLPQLLQQQQPRTKTLFLELHVGGEMYLPGMAGLHPYLVHWRSLAQRHDMPFFAFCLLREPASYHKSYYTFFHAERCTKSFCEKPKFANLSDQTLIQTAVPNQQCHTLVYGQYLGNHEPPLDTVHPPVTRDECWSTVNMFLQHDWDHVGRTEDLSNLILPALSKLLMLNHSQQITNKIYNKGSNWVKKEFEIQNQTRDYLRYNLSNLDLELYQRLPAMNFVNLTGLLDD
jgi:hypothetical protein